MAELHLSEALRDLRAPDPPPVDVRASVAARIAALVSHDPGPLPAGTLGWAFAFAFGSIMVLAGSAVFLAPALAEAWPTARATGGGLLAAGVAIGRFILGAIEPFVVPVSTAVDALLVRLADPGQRAVGHALILTAFVLTIGLSAWLVARDLARPEGVRSEEI
jgi:hypothetical protein